MFHTIAHDIRLILDKQLIGKLRYLIDPRADVLVQKDDGKTIKYSAVKILPKSIPKS